MVGVEGENRNKLGACQLAEHLGSDIRVIIVVESNREKYQSEEDTIQRQHEGENISHSCSLNGCSRISLGLWLDF